MFFLVAAGLGTFLVVNAARSKGQTITPTGIVQVTPTQIVSTDTPEPPTATPKPTPTPPPPPGPLGTGYLHTSGSQLLNATNQPVRITGINWSGLETPSYTVHGLDVRGYTSILDQIKKLGYNTVRLPFSNQLFDPGSTPNGIQYSIGRNFELRGLTTGLKIMDKIIAYGGSIGLKFLLDQHAPAANNQSALWYTPAYPESRWISDWQMLATHYLGNTAVIGADLHNEPYAPACWGCGDVKTDWRLAAERGGNAILKVNPHWLIAVEGIGNDNGFYTWWGGDLRLAGQYPVQLNVAHQLVYSPHDYTLDVAYVPWFKDPTYPNNLPGLWDKDWGYLAQQHIAPVLLGEFGTNLSTVSDRQWFVTLTRYLGKGATGFSWMYWSLNPESVDTKGILQDDWTTVNTTKQSYLTPIEFSS